MDDTTTNPVYNNQDKVVALVNGIEPLAAKETTYANFKPSPTLDIFWSDDKYPAKSGGLEGPEVTIDEPIKKSLEDNRINEARRKSSSSSQKNKIGSPQRKPSSSSNQRKPSTGSRDSKVDTHETYDDVELPRRGDSGKKLLRGTSKKGSKWYISPVYLVIGIIIIMLVAATAIIAGVIVGVSKDTSSCKEEFVKHENKFAFGGERRTTTSSTEGCARLCKKYDWCGGFDYERIKKECYIIRGAVNPQTLHTARSTDHYERNGVCNRTSEETPSACSMIHSANGQASGGTDIGYRSLEDCNGYCLKESGCTGIDYTDESKCFVHTYNDDTRQDDCCQHHDKVCKRCTYTLEEDRYSKAARKFDHIRTLTECGQLCDSKADCAGFDFELTPNFCALLYTPGYTTTNYKTIINYRKGQCYETKAPTSL